MLNRDIFKMKRQVFTDALYKLGNLKIRVSGDSMEPVLYDGDYILVGKPLNLKSGDIVWFMDENGVMVLHRMVTEKDGKYVLRGDNADAFDVVLFDNMIGKMICKLDKVEVEDENRKNVFSVAYADFSVDLMLVDGLVSQLAIERLDNCSTGVENG